MRKYWKTTAIIVLIMLSIGTFYVNSARSAENLPVFMIQTLSGDPKEIEPLVLEGSYTDMSSMNYVSSNVKINAEGSVYNSRSFLDQVIGNYPTVIKELHEEYRTFMRGKNIWAESYFENNEVLAYAELNDDMGSLRSRDFTFTISILNKKDDTTNSFSVEVPKARELDNIFVEDVQMIDGELYLITRNMLRNNDNSFNANYIYTIDIENQKISNQESIVEVPQEQGNTYTNVRLIESSPTKANKHLIFEITVEKIIEEKESARVEEYNKEIISYNLATKEKESLNVSDLKMNENQLSFYDGSTLYFTKIDGQELVVTPFSLRDNQATKAFRIQLSSEEGNVHNPVINVKDGKLYAITSQMNSNVNADVIVTDLTTGENLFSGQVVSLREQGKFELYLYELFVK
ncbi:hypothetical protein PY093_17400 [Cytobacillus sp. S13-E01]|uniref:hypothetical protein n=1 Tax=Cytobacillus sp. S13-E01 TaxID=3031326 RepID=UPI0023D80DFC|nr:hypothetical protein [Cytobacillus sp. S13-E01]MDF0728418.1 hypothetical protein [Cytobacillus sp. S13-E01]